jgi:L-ribulose-5-phosphate 4-epimerase
VIAHLDYPAVPAVLVANHGPFTWGSNAPAAAHNAVMLESLARMAFLTTTLNHEAEPISSVLHDRHYLRKHGRTAYYGQAEEKK